MILSIGYSLHLSYYYILSRKWQKMIRIERELIIKNRLLNRLCFGFSDYHIINQKGREKGQNELCSFFILHIFNGFYPGAE